MRLALLFHNFGPYHLARLSASIALGRQRGVTVFGLETVRNSDAYPWITEAGEMRNYIYTLAPGLGQNDGHHGSIIFQTWLALNHLRPEALAICGYDRWEMLTGLAWAKRRGRVVVFMSDSKADDLPRNFLKETMKSCLVRRFDAALVGGAPHKDYAISLGIPPQRVFTGYDVVDNDYYARGADAARSQADTLRLELRLPVPYFLNVGRFIEKKNLFRLLEAYRIYRRESSGRPWDLVVCGSGPLEAKLKGAAADLPGVHFPGFKQADELTKYYGLASVFIIPSSHFEQWGLVVNEAMASGLPVLVSNACGCAPDLVQEGVNGFTFDPYDVDRLARLMVRMSSGEVDLQAMREASQRIIADWTPEVFAQNLFKAVEAAQEAKRSKRWWWGRA
jgi:glycosyltransferase involved in cell wall biosynthesis